MDLSGRQLPISPKVISTHPPYPPTVPASHHGKQPASTTTQGVTSTRPCRLISLRSFTTKAGRGNTSHAPQIPSYLTTLPPHRRLEPDRCSLTRSTHQFNVSGLIVFNLFLCFCHVLQLAFSNRTPFAISYLCLVIDLQLAQTSSSDQSCDR